MTCTACFFAEVEEDWFLGVQKKKIRHIKKKQKQHRRTSYEKKQVVWLADRLCQCRDGGRDEHGTGAGRG